MAAAILLVAVAVLYHDVLFLGRSVIPSNFHNPIDYRRTTENYGPEMVPLSEWSDRNLIASPNLRDPGATWWQWEPGIRFLERAVSDGEWPFWDPYLAAGTPAMANLLPAFFFPPYLVVVALGASPTVLNTYFLFLLWAAALLTFAFLRDHQLDFVSALTGGGAVLVSGALVQHIGTFIGQTAACMALAMWSTRQFLDAPTRRRTAGLALAYACTSLASFPPVLVAIFGIAALYVCIGTFEYPPSRRLGVLGRWVIGAALALGLVGFYYLPALFAKAASTQVADLYELAGLQTMPAENLFQLLSPTLMGGLRTYAEMPISVQGPFLPFIGVVTVGLSLLAGASPGYTRRRSLLVASIVAAGALILKLIGTPGIQLMGHLPFLREIHMAHYFGIPLGFVLAFLAALGMQRLRERSVSFARAGMVGAALVLLVEAVWRQAARKGVFESAAADYWLRDWWVLALAAVGVAIFLCLAALWGERTRRVASVGLLLLLAAENGYNGWYPNPAAWDVFANPPAYVKALRQSANERALTFGSPNANLNSAFGIATLDSLMAFNPPRIYALYHRHLGPPRAVFMREARKIPTEPVLDRAGIGVVSINKFVPNVLADAMSRGYRTVFDDGLIVLFRRPDPQRFKFATSFRVASAAEALEAIAYEDPGVVILEQDPGFPPSDGPDEVAVRVESHGLNAVTLSVDAPRAGLVYAAESFADGWTATVNGEAATVLPANYAFRAVVVGPGPNRVEFRYWPPGLTAGLWLTSLSAAVLIGFLIARGQPVRASTAWAESA